MDNLKLKQKIRELRARGKTYSEIQASLNISLPKSTLSNWCSDIDISENQKERINKITLENLSKARIFSLAANKIKRENKFLDIVRENEHLNLLKNNKDTAKVILAVIYLCEGTKNSKSNTSITLGNSDPAIIKLFLQLLRFCYKIDEDKFRCTVQCRHDQNIEDLESFWSNLTKISRHKFYRARIDPRSIGKKSLKPNYKGVCRINYFSAEIFWEIMKVGEIICQN